MTARVKNTGFTLIELMISIVIGLLLVTAVLTIYVSMSTSNVEYLKSVRLNHELRSALSVMARDIRRAGHNRSAASDSTASPAANPFSVDGGTRLTITGNTIAFAYDAEADGTVETYGYRLNGTTGAIQYCDGTATACTDWEDLTDASLVEITALTFVEDSSTVSGITNRVVAINVTGRLRNDTEFTRTLGETVKVRNEHF